MAQMKATFSTLGKVVNGWNISLENIGSYGTNYLARATIALIGLGANLPQDAVYPSNPGIDEAGQPLGATHRYVLHFEPGQTPPANAFWSLTMYDERGFLVDNPIRRYAIGDRDPLLFNDDGSLDIYIQRQSPGADKESNWLPAPEDGTFAPTLRLYWPKDIVLSGQWKPPSIQRVR